MVGDWRDWSIEKVSSNEVDKVMVSMTAWMLWSNRNSVVHNREVSFYIVSCSAKFSLVLWLGDSAWATKDVSVVGAVIAYMLDATRERGGEGQC